MSESGRDQAMRLAERFAADTIAAIVTSPLQRAIETAAPIAGRLGLQSTIDPAFEEIDFGRWTGQQFAVLDHDPAWHAWNRLRSVNACPDGETMHAAQSRALNGLHRLHHAFPDQALLVVSHADIVRALLAPALGLPLDWIYRLTIDLASVSTLVLFDDDIRVDGINR